MKKWIVIIMCSTVLMSSCYTTESGAYNGAVFGSIVGSAIGDLAGGWRGHEIGKIAGLAGGAIVGAAIGNAQEQERKKEFERNTRRQEPQPQPEADNGYDASGHGDDRIEIEGLSGPSGTTAYSLASSPLRVLNIRFVDDSGDKVLTRGEEARVMMEISNTTNSPVFNVRPSVLEISGNKHVHVSQNIIVECIQPMQTIRYTAMVKADSRLKNGEAIFRVGVMNGRHTLPSQTKRFRVETRKK